MPKIKTTIKGNTMPLPFPPHLTPDDLLDRTRRGDGTKPGKIPNCFLIYRIVWVEHLKKTSNKLDLSEISGFVSNRWKEETKEVKDYYKKLSADAKKKFNANNHSRVFIFHNKCTSNNTESEIPSSFQTSVVNNLKPSETAAESSIGVDCISIPLEFDVTSIQQNQQIQPQLNTNFTSDLYSSVAVTSPITNNLNNGSLKDIMSCVINPFTEMLTSDNYGLFLNSTTSVIVTPEELGRVTKYLGHLKSIINEKSNASKCIMLARFNAICEKMKELELISTKVENSQDNYNPQNTYNSQDNFSPQDNYNSRDNYFDPTRGIQGIPAGINTDFIYNEYEYTPYQPLDVLTPMTPSSSSTDLYSNYPADNTVFSSQLNNNNQLFNYLMDSNKALEDRNKILEDKFRRAQELIKTIGGLICGNK